MKNITQLLLSLTLAGFLVSCTTDPGAVDPDNPGGTPGGWALTKKLFTIQIRRSS